MSELTYASFMVRLWRNSAVVGAHEQEPVWMGELESVQTGRTCQFQGLDLLLALLVTQLPAKSPTTYRLEESS